METFGNGYHELGEEDNVNNGKGIITKRGERIMKKLRVIIISILLICLSATSVYAGNYAGGFGTTAKKKFGLEYNKSFVTLNTAKKAIKKWNVESQNVSLSYAKKRTVSKGVNVSIGKAKPPNKTNLGVTLYSYRGKRTNANEKYDLALCMIYASDYFNKCNSPSIQATITHEIGHALSLTHTSGKTDIMKQGVKNYTKLSETDKKWLRQKWGN